MSALDHAFRYAGEPYSIQLREKAEQVADQLAIPYRHGVYTLFQGPYYETAQKSYGSAAGSDANNIHCRRL